MNNQENIINSRKINIFVTILSFFGSIILTATAFSQTVITADLPQHSGETIVFYTYNDYITEFEKELCSGVVDMKGHLKISFSLNETVYAFVPWGNSLGYIYLEPDKKYELIFPPKEEKSEEQELNPFFEPYNFHIGVANSTDTELNFLIWDFDTKYNEYLSTNFKAIYLKSYTSNIDTQIVSLDNQYKNIDNNFFNVYKENKFVSLKNLAYLRDADVVLDSFFADKNVQYENNSYMALFKQLTKDYLANLCGKPAGYKIHDDIETIKSYKALNKSLDAFPVLRKQNFRELIILKGLHDAFYTKSFSPAAIINMLDSVAQKTTVPEHRIISENIKQKITQLMIGYDAPDFLLIDAKGNKMSLTNFRGKYIYLNFCTSSSYTCKLEYNLLKTIQNKYSEYLNVVTISADKNYGSMRKSVSENEYNWTFLHYSLQPSIIKNYNVQAYPTYFLIDPQGKISLAPAMAPDENFDVFMSELIENLHIEEARKKALGID